MIKVFTAALLGFAAVWGLHPRSKHLGRYDLQSLVKVNPGLKDYVFVSPKTNDLTVDWGDDSSVLALNKALLMKFYGVGIEYNVPRGYLIPPVPSRADYCHIIADLLSSTNESSNKKVVGLDVGCGANLIYPLIASAEYGWEMVGSEISPSALSIAELNARATIHKDKISLRLQRNPERIFDGVVEKGEKFSFCMCNPPFHASKKLAEAASQRKARNLNLSDRKNFSGQSQELWCAGGELAFIMKMIMESRSYNLGWVTSLVSNKSNLQTLKNFILSQTGCSVEIKEALISTGNKEASVLCWKFRH